MLSKQELLKAPLFSLYFLILISAYYFLKPLSRSMYITYVGSEHLPYVWIATTLALSIIIPLFHLKISNVHPLRLTLALILSLTILLTFFSYLLESPSVSSAFTFYILVDVYSVLIVENFWSLTNSSYASNTGKRWYGLIATGGLLGGIIGGTAGSKLIEHWGFTPLDLIPLASIAFIGSLLVVFLIFKNNFVGETSTKKDGSSAGFKDIYEDLIQSTYLRWVAFLLFASQLIEPLVEYQFMSMVESSIITFEERTQYVSQVLAYTSTLGIIVSLAIVPLLHKVGGVAAGLMLQPLFISISSLTFLFYQSLTAISVLKIIDRGLAYSSGRASRELLYIPFDRTSIYKIKAWIDVYGYRFFRIFGSLVLLLFTKWLQVVDPLLISVILTLLVAAVWLYYVLKLKKLITSAS